MKAYEDETEVTCTSVLGVYMGTFLVDNSTLPQLEAINHSNEGGNYFRWEK